MINIKQIFCRHNFKYYATRKRTISPFPYMCTWDRVCKCEKCGKEKIEK